MVISSQRSGPRNRPRRAIRHKRAIRDNTAWAACQCLCYLEHSAGATKVHSLSVTPCSSYTNGMEECDEYLGLMLSDTDVVENGMTGK
jgi:hypothetical protein